MSHSDVSPRHPAIPRASWHIHTPAYLPFAPSFEMMQTRTPAVDKNELDTIDKARPVPLADISQRRGDTAQSSYIPHIARSVPTDEVPSLVIDTSSSSTPASPIIDTPKLPSSNSSDSDDFAVIAFNPSIAAAEGAASSAKIYLAQLSLPQPPAVLRKSSF